MGDTTGGRENLHNCAVRLILALLRGSSRWTLYVLRHLAQPCKRRAKPHRLSYGSPSFLSFIFSFSSFHSLPLVGYNQCRKEEENS